METYFLQKISFELEFEFWLLQGPRKIILHKASS